MNQKPQMNKSTFYTPPFRPAPPTLAEKIAPWLTNITHLLFVVFMLCLGVLFVTDMVVAHLEALTDITKN